MTSPAPQPATTHHCWKCSYPLPAPGEHTCPECGHRGRSVPIPTAAGDRRPFALGTALIIAAVAILPLLAAAVSALLRL